MKEQIAKLYADGLHDDLSPNVFADKVLRLLFDDIYMMSEQDLERLQDVADQCLYEGANNDLHIGRRGIQKVLKEWIEMIGSN